MTTSQTTNLHLTKAVKGTNEPFSIDDVNANLDTIDAKVGAVGSTDLQSQVTELNEAVSEKVIAGNGTNAQIAQMTSGTQLFGIYANAANNHRYALIVQSDKLALYDFTIREVIKTWQ